MKRLSRLLLLSLFSLCLSGPSRAEVVDRVVAVVNNDVITLSELDEMVNGVHKSTLDPIVDAAQRQAKRTELRKEVLEQMIDQRVLTQQYDALQIRATEQDIEGTIDAICQANRLTRSELVAELERQGINYSDYRDQMRQHILQTRFVEQQIRPHINLTEDDVKALYNKKLGEFTSDEVVELTGVMVGLARGGGPEAVEAAQKQAEVARAALKAGSTPDDIARQSANGSVSSLGDMGTFRRGELMEQLDSVVFGLKAGEVTPAIETTQEFYILKVVSLGSRAEARPYDEVRDQLFRQLFDQQLETQMQIFVRNARKEAHVEQLL